MTFRFEYKNKLHISDYTKTKILIKNLDGKQLYPKRKISSLYFDTKNYDMFHESEEGSLPRKKIRIRNYPGSSKNEYFLEIKISSVEGKFKTSIKKNIDEISYIKSNGYFDSAYGLCYPTLWVSYLREYFIINDHRITLDHDIEYESYNFNYNYKDKEVLILELKSRGKIVNNFFEDLIPIQKIRYSKYCNGIEFLYNNIIYQRLSKKF